MDPAVSTPPPRPRTATRRWPFRLLLLGVLIGLAEGASWLTFWSVAGHRFSYRDAQRERHGLILAAGGDAGHPSQETFHSDIHPYMGFAYNPDWLGKFPAEDKASDWGFSDKTGLSPVRKRGPNKVVVGILGASVANIFYSHGTDALAKELKQSPQFSGKEIEFVSLAVGGFKQPQQLMALNYALALGAEFDVLVNIDGLNEVAWYKPENAPSGLFHMYPTGWHWIVQKMPDAASRRQVGRIAYMADERASWARLFRKSPLRYSVTANLLWKLRDKMLNADINRTEVAVRSQKVNLLPYRARGPANEFHDDDGMLAALVGDWERGSMLIDTICRAHGIRYYHFLQPNQYVPGAKPLSAEEKKVAWWETMPGRPWIERGYPLLRQAGERLARRGIHYRDLSMVFAKTEDTLYFDNCCHFNHKGNEIMAVPIAQAILETPEPPTAAANAGPRPVPARPVSLRRENSP